MNNCLQKTARFAVPMLMVSCLFLLPTGCAALGVAAHAIPQNVKPKYTGLQNQTIGVMVWADQGILIDWPLIQLDLANAVQKKLQASKSDDLKGAQFPVLAASIVRYQRDHPSEQYSPVQEVAPKLGVSRLIYIEIQDFRTRPEASMEMYRGTISATIRVVEVANGVGKTPYVENDVKAQFPKKSNEVGVANIGDYRAYVGVLGEFSDEVVNRFVTHDSED